MATVDPGFAEWLQSPARTVVARDDSLGSRWGRRATFTEVDCAFDAEAAAAAEAGRQLAFFGGPLVEEAAVVSGVLDVNNLRGKTITLRLTGDPIFGAGALVFVLGGVADRASGLTTLYLLRRL